IDVDAVAGGLVRTRCNVEIDRGDAAAGGQYQRIGAGAAVDRGLGAVIGDDVIAGAGIDDVSAAAAVDGIDAAAGGDVVRRRRPGHRQPVADQVGVQVLE